MARSGVRRLLFIENEAVTFAYISNFTFFKRLNVSIFRQHAEVQRNQRQSRFKLKFNLVIHQAPLCFGMQSDIEPVGNWPLNSESARGDMSAL